jgi:hypothetical protein
MRCCALLAAALLSVPATRAAAPAARTAAAPASCLPADAYSANLVSFFAQLVTSADTADATLRNKLKLSAVPASQVSLVTDQRTCQNAIQGMDRALQPQTPTASAYVVKVGESYAVQDPADRAGEWTPAVVLDSKFNYTGMVLAP